MNGLLLVNGITLWGVEPWTSALRSLRSAAEVIRLCNDVCRLLSFILTTQVYVNPGVRYAVCQFEEVEWVIGVSAPVGLTRDTPDIGIFAYMLIEHSFRKIRKNGGVAAQGRSVVRIGSWLC